MRRADQIFDQIVDTVNKSLARKGMRSGSMMNLDALVQSIAVGVAEAIFDAIAAHDIMSAGNGNDNAALRFEQFAGLIKMLGDQVAEHNAALLMLTAPQPQSQAADRPNVVQCYCGWKHTGGQCVVCGREQASGRV